MTKNITNISPQETAILRLYCNDYTKELHGREIARQLHANHRTILLALQKLEEKNIFSTKQMGKNKLFKLNIQNILTREYLTSVEILKTVSVLEKHFFLKKFLYELTPIINTKPLILFGSYAKGIEHKESDLDLVLCDQNKDKSIEQKIKDFGKQYRIKIQLQKATRKDLEKGLREKDPLIQEIVKDHIILNNYQYLIGILWNYAHERS
ncbi:nucleotidyltransferase domain-containing protein [Candidatus Woesearchaeota archaeon]|nr:nucleotidyltransferase domain-containing protein [Candidatus Woesearchaeota archaeon]